MTHINTLQLHRLRYGELSPDEERALREHLRGCAACTERLHAQERHRAAFQLQPLPAEIRARPQPWWRRVVALAPVGALAVAGLTLALLAPPADPGVRTKGAAGPGLEAWVQAAGRARPVAPEERLGEGDAVQLRYRTALPWVTVAGQDGTGVVEVLGTWEAQGQGWQELPVAFTLDDEAGPQRFFAVYSTVRPGRDEVIGWVTGDAPQESGRIAQVVLLKEE
ncbi:MAG: zf-HC2 domain-containing protein [Deltaproteobacteria bacterium]|nr:zf-HC2 domain-containing protein [Deltaproteobacteria bacterium]